MLDDPEMTFRLLAALKQAVPFRVALTPEVVLHLRKKQIAAVEVQQTVADLSYAGDEGGIGATSLRQTADPRCSCR